MKGYQFLENDFFDLCRKRRISSFSMLLLIYLRGLYRYFGKPKFYWKDSQAIEHLHTTRPTLRLARNKLRERGIIEFKVGKSRFCFTEYAILQTTLAPALTMKGKGLTMKDTFTVKHAQKGQNLSQSVYKSKEIKPLEDTKGMKSITQERFIPKPLRWQKRPDHISKEIKQILGKRKKSK